MRPSVWTRVPAAGAHVSPKGHTLTPSFASDSRELPSPDEGSATRTFLAQGWSTCHLQPQCSARRSAVAQSPLGPSLSAEHPGSGASHVADRTQRTALCASLQGLRLLRGSIAPFSGAAHQQVERRAGGSVPASPAGGWKLRESPPRGTAQVPGSVAVPLLPTARRCAPLV